MFLVKRLRKYFRFRTGTESMACALRPPYFESRIRVALLLTILLTIRVTAVGTWEISGDGEVFSFQADEADPADIIRGLEAMSGVTLNVKRLPTEKVSVKYFNVTLDQLMYRLGLDYVLEYTKNKEDGQFELSRGWINYSEPVRKKSGDFVEVTPDQETSGLPGTDTGGGDLIFPEEVRKKLAVAAPGSDESPTYRAAYPVSPNIDGRTGDWPSGVPWQQISSGSSIGVNAPTNDHDASFAMAGVADGNNMYLALAIRDDMKAVTNRVRLPLQNDDAIRLYLSSPGGANPLSININRHHVLTSSSVSSGTLKAAPVQYVSYHNGVKAVIMDDDDGWRIEMSVPLDPLGGTPADGLIGFDVLLQDVDASEPASSLLSWSRNASLQFSTDNPPYSGLGRMEFIDIR